MINNSETFSLQIESNSPKHKDVHVILKSSKKKNFKQQILTIWEAGTRQCLRFLFPKEKEHLIGYQISFNHLLIN